MYLSLEALTDAEILKVIKFNEPSSFSTDITEINGQYVSSSFTVELSSEKNWSATTIPSWITVSPSSGSGDATLTITFTKNTIYSQRTGTIVFTDSENNTCQIQCTQERHPLLLPNNNIYRGGMIIN